jgi:hypothetical protein
MDIIFGAVLGSLIGAFMGLFTKSFFPLDDVSVNNPEPDQEF